MAVSHKQMQVLELLSILLCFFFPRFNEFSFSVEIPFSLNLGGFFSKV